MEGTPAVDLIADIPSNGIGDTNGVVVEDDGSTLGSIDPTELLFVGGKSITAKTIAAKEDTLFIGNIKENRKKISIEKNEYSLGTDLESIETISNSSFYGYNIDKKNI